MEHNALCYFNYTVYTWHGNWHLYSPSDRNLANLEDQLCFDTGVNNHDSPLSYEEVTAIMQTKKWEVPPQDR